MGAWIETPLATVRQTESPAKCPEGGPLALWAITHCKDAPLKLAKIDLLRQCGFDALTGILGIPDSREHNLDAFTWNGCHHVAARELDAIDVTPTIHAAEQCKRQTGPDPRTDVLNRIAVCCASPRPTGRDPSPSRPQRPSISVLIRIIRIVTSSRYNARHGFRLAL